MPNPDFIPLGQLLAQGRPAAHPVCATAQRELVWEDLVRATGRWQAAFAAQPGEHWGLFIKDSFDFAAALLGAWSAGKQVHLPPDDTLASFELLRAHVQGFAGDLPQGLQKAPTAPDKAGRFPAPPVMVLYTSGSSGVPTAVPKRLDQLEAELSAQEAQFGDQLGKARILATVSHQHIYGLLFKVLWPLSSGRAFDARQLFFPEDIIEAASGAHQAVLVSSPAHLKRLPRDLAWASLTQRWRAVFSSGGPLAWDAAENAKACLGQMPIEIYGSTETGGVAWRQRRQEQGAWQALPGVKVAVDEATKNLKIRSAHLATPDWLLSSDQARVDDAGFELLGRSDRIVKIEEKRISLAAIEKALCASGLVSEARVLSLPGERLTLAAVAVPTSTGKALLDSGGKHALNTALRDAAALSVERVGLPRRFRYESALPANAQGKATEAALLELFAQEDAPRLPQILSQAVNGSKARLKLRLPASLYYFKGHFPGAGILPGVAQIDWAMHFGRSLLGAPQGFLRMDALKFQNVLQPGEEPELELEYKAERHTLYFEYRSARGRHASGRLVLA